jgi:hypothetical protein
MSAFKVERSVDQKTAEDGNGSPAGLPDADWIRTPDWPLAIGYAPGRSQDTSPGQALRVSSSVNE